jgi:glycosyltransferase involved in cell wall biosynthesis
LKEAIESTLNQSYRDFEYLIIDDCSTDKSVKVIESYDDSRIRLVKNTKNLGTAENINKGLSIIDSKYIVRLDQDDVSLANRVEEQISYLEKNPDLDIICSWEHTIDHNGKRIRDWKTEIRNYGEFLGPILLGLCPIWHPSIAFKKDSLVNAGGFNSDYTRAEDFEVTTRMALKRLNAAIVPNYLLQVREHNNRQSVQFANVQMTVNRRIHTEAIKYFINGSLVDDFGYYLRLESIPNVKKNNKLQLINFNKVLHELFDAVQKKQKLTHEEMKSLKKVFIKRLGLGLLYCHNFKFLPEFFFNISFTLLSPLTNPGIRKVLSKAYSLLKH